MRQMGEAGWGPGGGEVGSIESISGKQQEVVPGLGSKSQHMLHCPIGPHLQNMNPKMDQ